MNELFPLSICHRTSTRTHIHIPERYSQVWKLICALTMARDVRNNVTHKHFTLYGSLHLGTNTKKHSHCSELLLVGWKIAGIFLERICMLEIKVCLRYTVIVYSIQWFWYAYMDVEKKKKTVMRRIELICCTVYQHRNVS